MIYPRICHQSCLVMANTALHAINHMPSLLPCTDTEAHLEVVQVVLQRSCGYYSAACNGLLQLQYGGAVHIQ